VGYSHHLAAIPRHRVALFTRGRGRRRRRSSAGWRSTTTIRAPSSASRTAQAWPMPDAAPEMTAILP